MSLAQKLKALNCFEYILWKSYWQIFEHICCKARWAWFLLIYLYFVRWTSDKSSGNVLSKNSTQGSRKASLFQDMNVYMEKVGTTKLYKKSKMWKSLKSWKHWTKFKKMKFTKQESQGYSVLFQVRFLHSLLWLILSYLKIIFQLIIGKHLDLFLNLV